jgi:hypothetical protein
VRGKWRALGHGKKCYAFWHRMASLPKCARQGMRLLSARYRRAGAFYLFAYLFSGKRQCALYLNLGNINFQFKIIYADLIPMGNAVWQKNTHSLKKKSIF